MTIDECLEILNALKQGKRIQYSVGDSNIWLNKINPVDGLGHLRLDFNRERYRVVDSGYRYRPYIGAEEFVNEACNHECMLIRSSERGQVLVPSVVNSTFIHCGEYRISYEDLVQRYVWYDDGTPVGVKL